MKKYGVYIETKVLYEIEVNAESFDEAEQKALKKAEGIRLVLNKKELILEDGSDSVQWIIINND